MWLQISNLNVANSDKIIFEQANYDTNDRCLIINGENGIGKSTLLNCIYKYQDYDGSIKLFENDIDKLSKKEVTRLISYAKQSSQLFLDLKVSTNLKLLNVDIQSFNNYYNQFEIKPMLFKKVKDLSGGEQQVINLCIALAKNSKCLLLDEPFNNLSVINKQILTTIINSDMRNIIVVTHEPIEVKEAMIITIEGRGFDA